MRGYDDWRVNGSWHTCPDCGARWSDSDGGPPCADCALCGAHFPDFEELEEINGNLYCKECVVEMREEEDE